MMFCTLSEVKLRLVLAIELYYTYHRHFFDMYFDITLNNLQSKTQCHFKSVLNEVR